MHLQHEVNELGTYWYCDYYLSQFVKELQTKYEDSLIFVTGDHSTILTKPWTGTERLQSLREDIGTSFYMYQKELEDSMFSNLKIGSHMNILPTIMELVAPKNHEYVSLFPSLFELQEIIVTPYHWISNSHIGFFKDQRVETLDGTPVYDYNLKDIVALQRAYMEVTGAIVRHYT